MFIEFVSYKQARWRGYKVGLCPICVAIDELDDRAESFCELNIEVVMASASGNLHCVNSVSALDKSKSGLLARL